MAQRVADLVPVAFNVDRTAAEADRVVIWVRAKTDDCACSDCGKRSRRVRSRYGAAHRPAARRPRTARRVAGDGSALSVRRCPLSSPDLRRAVCGWHPGPARPANRTAGPHRSHLGLALGGRPAAAFAARLMIAVSNDTLLRVVRRRAWPPADRLAVIGIDDFAGRRNHRYGTIVCDLERRWTVALLADREQATAEDWLRGHSDIAIVARDRGGRYGEAIGTALPDAVQVADRWHLNHNASQAFLDAVRKSMRQIGRVIGAATINPEPVRRFEVFTGAGRRRRWTPAEKARIAEESWSGAESVCSVARRHGLASTQLFAWRKASHGGDVVRARAARRRAGRRRWQSLRRSGGARGTAALSWRSTAWWCGSAAARRSGRLRR